MKLSWRTGIALVIGGIALGGTLSSFAQDPGGKQDVMFAHNGGPGPHFIGHGGVVTSEMLVEGEDEGTFKTIRTDAGTLKSVDGSTLTIERADGTTVDVPTSGDTEFRRERDEAEVSDLEVGDHVVAHRVKDGDASFVTKHVFAISAERYAEMEANREACTDDDESTECEGPKRGFHPGVEPADKPAMFHLPAEAA